MISVIIGAHGPEFWRDLAEARALPSAQTQTDDAFVVYQPDGTVATARNQGAKRANNDWLCFLDADDQLDGAYITAMTKEIMAHNSAARLFTPRVSYVNRRGHGTPPQFHVYVPPEEGNWLVIGTVISRTMFRKIGGFEEWPIYEDWALFARAQKAGAEVVKVPAAVYRAHRPEPGRTGRNHSLDQAGKLAAHRDIHAAIYGKGTA